MTTTLLLALWSVQPLPEARLIHVTKIWDKAPHCAFTDLAFWKNQFICVFRVGKGHVSDDGMIQVIGSENGKTWSDLATLTSKVADLRDPHLAIGSNDELLLYAAGALHDKSKHTHQSYVWSSSDGKAWSSPQPIGEPDSWLWRVVRQPNGYFYGWGYGTNQSRFIELFKSDSGKSFSRHTPAILAEKGYPNETGMVIDKENAWCLLRRDGKAPMNRALLGNAKAPFVEWKWKEMNFAIGGPVLMKLSTGQFLATVRLYEPKVRTALCFVDMEKAELKELMSLPSAGDCSYAGMVWHQERLWISYYSSHEGKSAIYLAEVGLKIP